MIDTLEHHYVQVNGIRMHYVRAGHGSELVVLLHGFPEFWYSWRYQIPALAEHFTVIAPDLRGYNETEKPRGGYEIRSLVQDIVDLIGALGFEKVHLVGHEWGGMIAWSLAIARCFEFAASGGIYGCAAWELASVAALLVYGLLPAAMAA